MSSKTKEQEFTKQVLEAGVLENKVVIWKAFEELAEKGYGKEIENRLDLAFTEALYLLEKGKIAAKKGKAKYDFKKLLNSGLKRDPRLHEKFIVYRDFRERGLVVKTGFKFGCDFRVYKRGIGVRKGPKKPGEHTKWIVFAVPEDYTCSFTELSRAVRLAHSIRAKMLWAIVDNENNVTFYRIERIKP
jgi:tRNA-intron endonuclease